MKTKMKTIAYLLGTADLESEDFHGICLHFVEEFCMDPAFEVAEFLAACTAARNGCYLSVSNADKIQITIALSSGNGGVA